MTRAHAVAYQSNPASRKDVGCFFSSEVEGRWEDMKPSKRFEPQSDEEMSADAVVQLLQLFEQHGIEVVVDGGWGVDALLGEQTRFHADVDIALEHKDVPKLRALLEARGYKDVPRDDTGTAPLSWAMSRDMRSISTPTRLMLMERWFLGGVSV